MYEDLTKVKEKYVARMTDGAFDGVVRASREDRRYAADIGEQAVRDFDAAVAKYKELYTKILNGFHKGSPVVINGVSTEASGNWDSPGQAAHYYAGELLLDWTRDRDLQEVVQDALDDWQG